MKRGGIRPADMQNRLQAEWSKMTLWEKPLQAMWDANEPDRTFSPDRSAEPFQRKKVRFSELTAIISPLQLSRMILVGFEMFKFYILTS